MARKSDGNGIRIQTSSWVGLDAKPKTVSSSAPRRRASADSGVIEVREDDEERPEVQRTGRRSVAFAEARPRGGSRWEAPTVRVAIPAQPAPSREMLSPASRTPTTEVIPENKEVFAAVSIQHQAKKRDNTAGEPVFKDHPSHCIVESMKMGLLRSIQNISPAAKSRPLRPKEDFTYKTKITFEDDKETGVPGFSFTDYSPMCYRHIREFLGVPAEHFREGLCFTDWKVSRAGKSSSLLYYAGSKYVVKTMNQTESKFLRRILHQYYHHIRSNPHTLLPRYLGHYSITPKATNRKITFFVMNNVFDTGGNLIHRKFDLKGSTIGRFANPCEKTEKDLDMNQHIIIGERRKALLLGQVYRDTAFLESCGIMDYSFLLGIHKPTTPEERRRRPQKMYDDERALQADDGGMLSDGSCAEYAGEIYYGGIIDILQEYTLQKRAENRAKGIFHDRHAISAVPPKEYARRFCDFLRNMIL